MWEWVKADAHASLTPYIIILDFYRLGGKTLLKTLGTRISFFCHNVFYSTVNNSDILVNFNLLSANPFIFD